MHKEIDLLKFARQEDSNVLRRTEASNQLLQKQITSLQAQLKSYDLEEQSMMKSYDIQKSHRIADLELLIVDYRTRNEMLELELKAQSQSIVQSQLQQHVKREYAQDDTFHLDQEMATLKNANEMLKTEVNSLEIQVGVLQHAIGRGEYDPTTTRIVMLADNPESKAALDRNQIHEAMAAENKELRMRLEQVGGACMPSRSACADEPQSGMIPIESLHTKEIQCNQLQEELDGCNKRMTRLKEVFGTKIQEFREAVYILLGFKVEIQIDGQVRVASMYAHNIDDPVLLFTSATNPQIELQLVGGTNESRNALHQNVQMYLEQHRSIPALLAATTLNWFERSNKLSN
ncbi:coiled-coil domain-containing protein mad1 [Batrachochytrium dendrobatidis]|nr:coiled-coil domain-containing protein mad1 [Batrachochytrium dendrobatidis]